MNDDTDTGTPVAEADLREETAAAAPEVAEHDRVAELTAQLAEAKAATLYAHAEAQNIRRRAATIGAGFAMRSTPGHGTSLEVVLRS